MNTRDRRNQTCLHMACAHGNSFVVHTLLRGGTVRFLHFYYEINH
jgi:ankyrin repeat protein